MIRPSRPLIAVLAVAAGLASCSRPRDDASAAAPTAAGNPSAQVSASVAEPGIAWQKAVSEADVDAAFAQAAKANKPLFLYWGAKWCPPCNQLQATLFNRQDFIERSRAFVPVYVDGDSPGAQKLGARYKVRGYPTMVMFNAQGTELTRLPGEVDAAQYTQVLTLSMNAQRPVTAVLADARAGGKGLSANDWRLLAFYSWDTDEQQLMAKAELPALLKQIAGACPAEPADVATRLWLKSVAAAKASPGLPLDEATTQRLLRLLGDAAAARAQMDVLGSSASELVSALSAPDTAQRRRLLGAFEIALKGFEADASLSRADRLTALHARVELARIDRPKESIEPVAETLLADVRAHVAAADRDISDGHERQAVIPFAGYVMQQAGLLDESDALLSANLAKSHSPYYLMSELSSNARKRGDKAGALRWSEAAFDKSEGPATRLQWGASYVNALIELSPGDETRIEKAVLGLLGETAQQTNPFYERSARSWQRVGKGLQTWNKERTHAAVLQRLQSRLDAVCAQLPNADPQRGVCESLFKPAPAAKGDT